MQNQTNSIVDHDKTLDSHIINEIREATYQKLCQFSAAELQFLLQEVQTYAGSLVHAIERTKDKAQNFLTFLITIIAGMLAIITTANLTIGISWLVFVAVCTYLWQIRQLLQQIDAPYPVSIINPRSAVLLENSELTAHQRKAMLIVFIEESIDSLQQLIRQFINFTLIFLVIFAVFYLGSLLWVWR